MSNLTIDEKKAFYVLIGIFVLCIFEYTIFNLSIMSTKIEDFLSILILGSIGIYIYTQPRALQKVKERLIGYYMIWLLACGIIYLVIYFGCGFMFGFGKNPYNRNAVGILTNVLVFGGTIVLKEWIRNYVINKAGKRLLLVYGLALVLMFTAIEINMVSLINARSIEEFTIIVCQKVLPILALNVFLTYVCYIAGYVPAIIYMLITSVPIWLFDNLPSLEWIVVAVLGVAFPMIALVALIETVNNTTSKRSKNIKSEPRTINVVVWIFVGGFCIITAFFTAGLFNTFPTVLISGSMSPAINRGDVVIIKKVKGDEEIYLDDIVMFNAGEYDVVHRVVDIRYEDGTTKYITKGDDNENIDQVNIELKNIGGIVIARIPYIGLPRLLIESTEYENEINGG